MENKKSEFDFDVDNTISSLLENLIYTVEKKQLIENFKMGFTKITMKCRIFNHYVTRE